MRLLLLVIFSLFASGCFDRSNNEMNLVIACSEGDIQKVESLLKVIDDPNFRSIKGDTPLISAVTNNHLDIVMVLVKKGADIHYKDASGKRAIDIAKKINPDIYDFLIKTSE